MTHPLFKAITATIGAAVASAAVLSSTSAAAPQALSCTLMAGQTQICPTHFRARAGRASRVVVARYADLSNCHLPDPPGEPGDNHNYVVASVKINWGDHTRVTSGIAHRGTKCPVQTGAGAYTTSGENEPVTGVHRYRKAGRYRVSVTLTYIRGSGNTYQNCATATPGDKTPNDLTNCIAENAPARSTGIVKKR